METTAKPWCARDGLTGRFWQSAPTKSGDPATGRCQTTEREEVQRRQNGPDGQARWVGVLSVAVRKVFKPTRTRHGFETISQEYQDKRRAYVYINQERIHIAIANRRLYCFISECNAQEKTEKTGQHIRMGAKKQRFAPIGAFWEGIPSSMSAGLPNKRRSVNRVFLPHPCGGVVSDAPLANLACTFQIHRVTVAMMLIRGPDILPIS